MCTVLFEWFTREQFELYAFYNVDDYDDGDADDDDEDGDDLQR